MCLGTPLVASQLGVYPPAFSALSAAAIAGREAHSKYFITRGQQSKTASHESASKAKMMAQEINLVMSAECGWKDRVQ
jgi:hypothetical protein